MVSKSKNRVTWRYLFAIVVVLLGLGLNYYDVGNEFLGFGSVGNWLVYVGFVMLVIITLQVVFNKKRIVDERMRALAFKASRITFVLIILAAFVVMIVDGVRPIAIPYHLFMSYIISYMVLVYFVAYKILERYY